MKSPITIPLSRPLHVIDQTFTELKLREPKGKDLLQAGDLTEGLSFLARVGASCSNIPFDALDDMAGRDVLALTAAVNSFLAPEIPQASSPDTSTAPAGGATRSNTSLA